MAALVAGVQYGLSSQSHFYENKSLIFVKLTDSAQRAIEDFLKNRNKSNQRPTIQFLENEGRLSFPSPQSNHGSVDFTFSLSDGHDVEGPQGAFECLQQTNPNNLESLGTLPYKMRIHANEDVYEKTRHRMAAAEENNKNKCTRVIKPNGPDIGRKVKVKATGKTIAAASSARHTNNHRDTSIPNSTSRPTVKNSIINSLSSSALSSQPSSAAPSFLPSNSLSNSSTVPSLSSSSATAAALTSRFYKSTSTASARSQPDKKLLELQKRPLRERLIHILALRPYKKPELYERLHREGLKERDKKDIATLLRPLATVRNNSYHLQRHVWNDVQEDWPFYSEQDRAMLKRRKPQNLTPPGSSDGGSSGSGQSPNSTHPGSPPAITAPPPNFMNCKRPGYYQGSDGIQTKRPRISHYRKPEPPVRTPSSGNSNTGNIVNNNNVVTSVSVPSGNNLSSNHNHNSNSNSNDVNNWNEQRQQSSDRDINYHRSERTSNSDVLRGNNSYQLNVNSNVNSKSGFTPNRDRDRDDLISNSNSSRTASTASSSSTVLSSASTLNAAKHDSGSGSNSSANGSANPGSNAGNPSEFSARDRERERRERDKEEIRRERERQRLERVEGVERQDKERNRDNSDNNWNGNASNGGNSAGNSAVAVAARGTAGTVGTVAKSYETNGNNNDDIPDYLMQYKPVRNVEERRRYKADYLAGHKEYEELYEKKLKRTRHFIRLRDMRERELKLGNFEKSEALGNQIKADYEKIKYDPREIENERRYLYLYNKLNYIKGLIDEFDRECEALDNNQTSNVNTSSNNSSETGVSITDLRY